MPDLRMIPGLILIMGLVGFFLFLGFLGYSVRRERSLVQLAALPCPNCKIPFGIEAANAALEEGERRMKKAMAEAENHGVRLRVVMLWPVTCRQCGRTFDFRPDNGSLHGSEMRAHF
jgi:hypothetical protein